VIDAGVDIWVTHLDDPAGEAERLRGLLDHTEAERAARFRSDLQRRRFTARHAIRRLVLAKYLDQPPETIAFLDADGRKPQVSGLQPGGLEFNESSSDGVAVFAVARGMELGIDVERIRPVPDAGGIVRRFGSPSEAAAYSGLAEQTDDIAFLRWWTAKEAFVKSIGSGLGHPLNAFSVSFSSHDRLRLLEVGGSRDEATHFSLTELTPAAGYVGTLVAIGRPARIRQCLWGPDGRIDARDAP
jgi:4'-phosphopantetheinyl transferase